MKRSEMVLEIANEILLNFPAKPLQGKKMPTWGEAQEMAEAVLKMQENEGMLPPQNPNVDNYSIAMGSNANFWEDEDEEE